MPKPKVLILGHSFVRRFAAFIARGVDKRDKNTLDLAESAQLAFQGVGGRTVDKINVFDLQRVRKVQPDIVILEIGSNDLCPRDAKPEIVGSRIETLVQHLHAYFNVRFIVVCQTIARSACPRDKQNVALCPCLTSTSTWFWMRYHSPNFGATRGFESQTFQSSRRMVFT